MIHAYLFVTDGNDDHDGHGPAFHEHMFRINKEAGTNISVYHNFHDEVALYNISDGAADTFRTTGDLLLPWMRKSDFRGALCPEQNSARCEASTFDAVGTLFRLMIPVAAAVREMARAVPVVQGC